MKKIITAIGMACIACAFVFATHINHSNITSELTKSNIEALSVQAQMADCYATEWGCPLPGMGYGQLIIW